MTIPTLQPRRIVSIDVFRALTMFFMIFVNDLWRLIDIPHWLEHASANEDMLGFSDLVFPSFLFILGMSIPLAIEIRLKKKDTHLKIAQHVLTRSIALIAMGLFTVNTEYGVLSGLGISAHWFTLAMLVGFFLIWNVYPKTENGKAKKLYTALKVVGIIILAGWVYLFRDAEGGLFQTRWWGILGLIGWTYLVCSLVYLFLRKHRQYLLVVFILFITLCIAGSSTSLGVIDGVIPSNGCFHGFTMAGLLLSLFFNLSKTELKESKKMWIAAGMGLLFIILGFVAHHFWIISKLQATPTWLFFCTGISILFYVFLYWLTDMKQKGTWFDLIKPAGTATLTCYLVPYLFYTLMRWTDYSLPDSLLTGGIGLLKSLVFAFVTIGFTALLVRIGVKLKV